MERMTISEYLRMHPDIARKCAVVCDTSTAADTAISTLKANTTPCTAHIVYSPNSYNYIDTVDSSGSSPDNLPPKDTFNTESLLNIKIKKHKVKFNFKL